MESQKILSRIFSHMRQEWITDGVHSLLASWNIQDFMKVLSRKIYFEQNSRNHESFLPQKFWAIRYTLIRYRYHIKENFFKDNKFCCFWRFTAASKMNSSKCFYSSFRMLIRQSNVVDPRNLICKIYHKEIASTYFCLKNYPLAIRYAHVHTCTPHVYDCMHVCMYVYTCTCKKYIHIHTTHVNNESIK